MGRLRAERTTMPQAELVASIEVTRRTVAAREHGNAFNGSK
jgi:DNA-binding XRE family transcriptional regulator